MKKDMDNLQQGSMAPIVKPLTASGHILSGPDLTDLIDKQRIVDIQELHQNVA